MSKPDLDRVFDDWKEREALAEAMIPLIGSLYRRNVEVYCYGRPLVNESVINLMKHHRFVRQTEQVELSEYETWPMLRAIHELDLGPAHLDLGKLTVNYMVDPEGMSVAEYARAKCASLIGDFKPPLSKSQDVVIYGFGRIGRLVARLLIEKTGGGTQLVLRAVVLRPHEDPVADIHKRANLLRCDSIHGGFKGTIRVDESAGVMICNGNVVRIIYAENPDSIDYRAHGINDALIIDSTGAWRDQAGLAGHLSARGAARVLLTTSGKKGVKNIVSGVNSHLVSRGDKIIAAGSCTTNAVVPVLKVMSLRFGIEQGHMETVHAYTNDQNLVDNDHPRERRGRSAPLNIVLTESNASSSISDLLPELKGRLTGNAIRVPVPNVSIAILHLTLSRETSREEVNEYLRGVALHSSLQRQIDYSVSPEVVSSDINGSRHTCVLDSHATLVKGRQAVIYLWYDNEFGYACQVVRVAQKMAGIHHRFLPEQAGIGDLSALASAGAS